MSTFPEVLQALANYLLTIDVAPQRIVSHQVLDKWNYRMLERMDYEKIFMSPEDLSQFLVENGGNKQTSTTPTIMPVQNI
jgi:hypothetical protein